MFDMQDAGMLASYVSMGDFLIPLARISPAFLDGSRINHCEIYAKLYEYTKHSCLTLMHRQIHLHCFKLYTWKHFGEENNYVNNFFEIQILWVGFCSSEKENFIVQILR